MFEDAGSLVVDSGPRRRDADPIGEIQSLWGRIVPAEMGVRAGREQAPLRPKKPATVSKSSQTAIDFITTVVAGAMDEQPSEVIASAVEDVIRILKNQDINEETKRTELNGLLQLTLDNDRFIQLSNLVAKLSDKLGVNTATFTAPDGTVPVEFDDDKSEDGVDLIGVIEDEEEDEPERVAGEEQVGIHGRKWVDLEALAFPLGSHTMTNQKCNLPEETVRHSMPGYEEIHVPAPSPFEPLDADLLPISKLPEYIHAAFAGIKSLNYIQSRVSDAVLRTDKNILLCAPTGAGKTNVALMSILKEMNEHGLDAFKCVYIAPMKALVQEMARNFTQRLAPYGMSVCELTGDAQSTRKELGEAHVIVATPEKWDVVSRKANDLSYTRLVRLVIVDEIHLLHDERGPVLEAIIMRLLLDQKERNEYLRIVGLSATLPNFVDVARFIHSTPSTTFMFDGHHRPVPLAQIFIGLTEKKPLRRMHIMNDVCYRKALERASASQTLIFVHSRKDAFKTAKMILDRAIEEGAIGKFIVGDQMIDEDVDGIQSAELKQIIKYGLAIHHAGLVRNDRLSVERWFAEGRIQLLVSTATLAWGVNLPAHTVIIKGTLVYRPDRGTWCELSGQDVLQMLGRAGRPQYDTQGEGIIITEHSGLPFYMSLSTMQLPIESQMISKLPVHLNAAIAYGFVNDLASACEWLRHSYLNIRMQASPANYGVSGSIDDGTENVCHSALVTLRRAKLIEYDYRTLAVFATELGRISSDYYLPIASAATYNDQLVRANLSEIDLFRIFSLSDEFKSMAVRKEEQLEIAKLLERVPIPVRASAEDPVAKVNVLLQAHISQLALNGLVLQADTVYVTQSASRILRAMLAVSIYKGYSRVSRILLNLCKCVDRRQWHVLSPLRQLSSLPVESISRLERRELPFDRLFDFNAEELGDLVRQPSMGPVILESLKRFPRVQLSANVSPLSSDEVEIELSIEPKWTGSLSELFWIFIEDPNGPCDLLAIDVVWFTDRTRGRNAVKKFRFPLTKSPVIFVNVASDHWIGAEARLPIAMMNMTVPTKPTPLPGLQDLKPVVVNGAKLDAILTNAYGAIEAVNGGTSAFVAVPADPSLLLPAIRAAKIVWLHPKPQYCRSVMSATAKEWFGEAAVRLTGDVQTDCKALEDNDNILMYGRVRDFEIISRRWKSKRAFHSIDLVVIFDCHLLSSDATVDICLSRLRYMQTELPSLRLLAFSQPILDGGEFGTWLVGRQGLSLPFDILVRPCEVVVNVLPQSHLPSLVLAATRPSLQVGDSGVVVFVDGYNEARQVALDLSIMTSNVKQDVIDMSQYQDAVLKETLKAGIAFLHESQSGAQQQQIIEMFNCGSITHLVITRESIWSFNCLRFAAKHVCILGTSIFDPSKNALVEYEEADVARMTLFASRVHIFTAKFAARRYQTRRSLHCESTLDNFGDHLNAAVASRVCTSKQEAVDLLTWTFMYHRLPSNPNYYGLDLGDDPSLAISSHLSDIVEEAVQALTDSRCIAIDEDDLTLKASNYGLIACHYGVHYLTIDMFALSAQRTTRLKGVLELVSAAVEFDGLRVRHGERQALQSLAAAVPVSLSPDRPLDDPHTKAHLLLQAHFSRIPLPAALYTDQQFCLTTAVKLAGALFDVLSTQSWLRACCAVAEFSQMLTQAMWDYDHPLCCIPNINNQMIEEARDKGIKSVYDFVDAEDDEWKRTWIGKCGDRTEQRAAIQAINRYPSLQISCISDGSVIKVTVERDAEEDLLVIAPFYPESKEEQWWIILADEQDTLVAVKKVSLRQERQEFDFAVSAARLILMCDSYLGCDQELKTY